MKRRITRLGAVCAAALVLGTTIAETTISTISNISYAETIAENNTEKGQFKFSDPIVDEAVSTIQWELILTKEASKENTTRQLLVSFSDFKGVELQSVTDAKGNQLSTEEEGAYLVGEDTQEAAEQKVIVTANLLGGETHAGLTVQPKVKETTTTIAENKDVMEPEIIDTEQTSETYDLSSDSGNRLEAEIPSTSTVNEETGTSETKTTDTSVVGKEEQTTTEESQSKDSEPIQQRSVATRDFEVVAVATTWRMLKDRIDEGATQIRVTGNIGAPGTNAADRGTINIDRPVKIIGWEGDINSGQSVLRSLNPTWNNTQTNNRKIYFNVREGADLVFENISFDLASTNINYLISGNARQVRFDKVIMTPMAGSGARQPLLDAGAEELVVNDSSLISANASSRSVFTDMRKVTLSGNNTLTGYPDEWTFFDHILGEVVFEEGSNLTVKNGNNSVGAHHIFWYTGAAGQNKMIFKGNNSIEMGRTGSGFVGGTAPVTLTSDVASLTPKNAANTVKLNLTSGNFADSSGNTMEFEAINLDVTQSGGKFATGELITFDQVTVEINIQTLDPNMKFVEARQFFVTNNSSITTPAGGGETFRLYYTEVSHSTMLVSGRSKIDIDGEKTVVSDFEDVVPAIIDFSNEGTYNKTSSQLIIEANSTVSLKGRSYNRGWDSYNNLFTEGLVAIKQQNSVIDVKTSSQVDLKNDYGTAVFMRGTNSKFNVNTQSKLNIVSGSGIASNLIPNTANTQANAEKYFTGIRMFGYIGVEDARGRYQFNIDNASFVLTKEQGNFKSAGIRLGGISNQINVVNNGYFEVTHMGEGNNEGIDPIGEGDLVAVQYDNILNGDNNKASFTLGQSGVADNSRVLIDAKGGAAIHAGRGQGQANGIISVTANPGTNFIARGKTNGAGIFNAASDNGAQGILEFKLDKSANYEIENYNITGDLLGAYHDDSKLDATNIWTSLWKKGEDHAENPSYIISRRDYTLNGRNFTANDPTEFSSGINQYSYMKSQNDIQARVAKFYQSTNADSSIFAKIELPKRNPDNTFVIDTDGQGRAHFVYEDASSTNEGALIISYTDQDGQRITTLGRSFDQGESGVSWAPGDVNIRIDLGAGKYLKPGTTIEILGSWYPGMKSPTDTTAPGVGEYGDYTVAELLGTQKVVDVLAPAVDVTTSEVVAEPSTTIAGTSEPGAKIVIYSSDYTKLETTEADANGAWTVTMDLSGEDKISVYAQDSSDLTDVTLFDGGPEGKLFGMQQSINKDQGNWTLDSRETVAYHDVSLLTTAYEIKVLAALRLVQVPKLDYGSHGIEELADENFAAPTSHADNKIVVYNSTANDDWKVQVATKPTWDQASSSIPENLAVLAFLKGSNDPKYLDGSTVDILDGTASKDQNNYSSSWSANEGILFELNPALSTGTYQGKVEFVLNDGL